MTDIELRRRMRIGGWALLGLGALAFLWASRGILGPFIAGLIIAYLLDPLVTRLMRLGLSRTTATTAAIATAVLLVGGAIAALYPMVQAQVLHFVEALPHYANTAAPWLERTIERFGGAEAARDIGSDVAKRAAAWASGMIGVVLASSLAFFSILSLVVVTPIVAFYTLLDWPHIKTKIIEMWPRKSVASMRGVLSECDVALSGFIRGQSLVCLAQGVLYAAGWSAIGLQYGLILGIAAGILSFIPYIGAVIGVGLALLIGIGQAGVDPLWIGSILAVYAAVQMIEGTFLTPRLVGGRIGLHPLWVLFAVFAGGEVFGLVGVLFAVPVAAVVGVLVRRIVDHYRGSGLYGPTAPSAHPEP